MSEHDTKVLQPRGTTPRADKPEEAEMRALAKLMKDGFRVEPTNASGSNWVAVYAPMLALLVACGEPPPVYRPTEVAPEYADMFAELAREVNDALGYEALAADSEGRGAIVVDDAAVDARSRNPQAHFVYGFTGKSSKIITLRTPGHNTDLYTLAHEIGHAFGLDHASSGLMREGVERSCIGKEAQCLVEALSILR